MVALVVLSSCGVPRAGTFRVLPASPDYLLRSPDGARTPFPEVLRRYNGFEPGRSGMDLRPQMELRIENAYYQDGMPRRGLAGFLGTEVAKYQVGLQGGLTLLSVQPMRERPTNQIPVQELIPAAQQHFHYYRFYYEILFKKDSETRGSVLLGAASPGELSEAAAALTTDPDSVCGNKSPRCTVFPDACSVSLEMEIAVNGASQSVLWGTDLGGVLNHQARPVNLQRVYRGRARRVQVDGRDVNALKLPLLPGDRIQLK